VKQAYYSCSYCPKCTGVNSLKVVESINGHVSEAETKCTQCGHVDYFAYGYFESMSEEAE